MNLEEARAELGVGLDASPDVARRAYLRLLKTRKPEVDPQGFARLREAYDVFKAAQEGTEAPRTQAAPEVPAPSAPPAEASAPLSAEARLETFRARFSTLPADAPPEMPVQVAREAVQALPEAAEARHWLIQALLAADRTEEAVQACREAFQQGHPEFLLRFAQRFPQHLTDAELQLLASMVEPPFLWGLADHCGRVEAWAHMGGVALVALEAMKRHPGNPPPEPSWFVSSILLLHAHGRVEEARELQRRYAAWVKAEGLVDAFLQDGVAWAWPLVGELGALGDGCAQEVRALLAQAVLTSEIDEAKAQLQAWRRDHPERAAEARALLRATCPRLDSVLGESLGAPAASSAASAASASSKQEKREKKPLPYGLKKFLTIVGGFAVLMAVSLVPALILDSEPAASRPSSGEGPPIVDPSRTARESAQEMCAAIPATNRGTGCLNLEGIIQAAESRDCPTVSRNYVKVISNLQRTPEPAPQYMSEEEAARSERIRRARGSLEAAIRTFCPRAL